MDQIREIPIDQIKVGEHDQRIEAEDDDIDGIAASVRRIGIIEPLILEEKGDTLQLVSGHRRLLAAVRVGLSTVPCIVKDSTKVKPSEITFAENFFRKDLSPIELACALKDCLSNEVMTVDELAAGFHRKEHWVHSMIAIASWPPDVQEAIHVKAISVSAAANLALVTDDIYRQFLVQNAVEQGATARTTSAWLQAFRQMQPPEQAVTAQPIPPGAPQVPLVPQAPCMCCAQLFKVNEMSHVPVCGACIQLLRVVGTSGVGQQE